MAPLVRRALTFAATAAGSAVGGTAGLVLGALVLGVATRVGEVSGGIAVLFTLSGAGAGGALAWAIARQKPKHGADS